MNSWIEIETAANQATFTLFYFGSPKLGISMHRQLLPLFILDVIFILYSPRKTVPTTAVMVVSSSDVDCHSLKVKINIFGLVKFKWSFSHWSSPSVNLILIVSVHLGRSGQNISILKHNPLDQILKSQVFFAEEKYLRHIFTFRRTRFLRFQNRNLPSFLTRTSAWWISST